MGECDEIFYRLPSIIWSGDMGTRSHIVLVTPENKVHQFYHHWDGYLAGVGKELRGYLLYSIGVAALDEDVSVYSVLLGELHRNEEYEDEHIHEMNEVTSLYCDVEYLYVVRGSDLFYVNEHTLCEKLATNKELVDYVCKDRNKINFTKPPR